MHHRTSTSLPSSTSPIGAVWIGKHDSRGSESKSPQPAAIEHHATGGWVLSTEIIYQLDCPMLIAAADGTVTDCNAAAALALHAAAVELIGRHRSSVIPVERRAEEAAQFARALSGENVCQLLTLRKIGAAVKPARLTLLPKFNHRRQVTEVLEILTLDTTAATPAVAPRAADSALCPPPTPAPPRSGGSDAQLHAYTARLEAALKELETFSYSVSHDLRAPLRAINGFARILDEEYASQLDADGQRLLQTIRSQARRMGQLIDDILTFSQVGRQQLDAADIDMTELARGAFQDLVEAMPHAKASLTLTHLPSACGDRSMMRQVLANLLGNAIKFSSTRSEPKIEVSGWSESDRNVYRISDNGVGFDPNYTSKLFTVFERLHSATEFEGTGVGLAIVQRVVHRHAGSVWAEGRPDAGASFYFSLPLRHAAAADSTHPAIGPGIPPHA